jgi:VanZ family protein
LFIFQTVIQSRCMLRKITSLAAWLILGFIVYATLSPLNERPSLFVTETSASVAIERFGAYGLMGLLFGVAYARRLTLVILVVLGSAISLELLQLFIADRDARLIDVVEKLTGGIAGIGASQILHALAQRLGRHDPT